jgi:hypothetical protein
MTKQERAALEAAATLLERLSDENDERCGVAPEHRRAVRAYVQTWILPKIRAVATPPSKRGINEHYILKHAERQTT